MTVKNDIIHIKRTEVPSYLKSKTELRKMGLRPTAEPFAFTYQQFGFSYCLYDVNYTKPLRKVSEKQIKALEKGRIKGLTCTKCGNVCCSRFHLNEDKVCEDCIVKEEIERENQRVKENKTEIKNRCLKYLRNPESYLVLDTETTGLEDNDEIVEISIIDTTGKVLFESLVKPSKSIPEDAVRIHGITDEIVSDAPTWDIVYKNVLSIIKDKTLLIYNSSFDTSMIFKSCRINNIETKDIYKEIKSICLMNMYSRYIGSARWVSLQNACISEEIKIGQVHRSKADCYLALELIKKIAKADI